MPLPVEVVFLAIQAGVRLYAGFRNAYVASVREATITLPLPRAPGLSTKTMADFFIGGQAEPWQMPPNDSALGRLIAKAGHGAELSDDEQAMLERAYGLCRAETKPPSTDVEGVSIPESVPALSSAEFMALTEVRQWAKGEAGEPPSTFQLVAGALVDTAVFWFVNQPGAISDKHPQGRALLAFLQGISDVDFATAAPHDILSRLLVGVLDTVAAEPRLLVGGRKEEALVTNVSKALAGALAERFKKPRTAGEQEDAASWAQLVARTVLKAGADTVLANPPLFLGVRPGDEASVVDGMGRAFLNLVVPDDPSRPDQIALAALVSGTGLENLVRAALQAVGEHPGVLGLGKPPTGIEALVGELATSFAQAKLPASAAAAFPEIAQIVLEKTAAHLDEIWGGTRTDVERNLLVLATRHTLEALAEAATNDGPVFTKTQLTLLFDAVLAEVVENPRWVVTRVGAVEESKLLSTALEAALTALRGQTLATLSGETRLAIVKAALKAGGQQLALLREIPPGGRDAGKIAVEAAIDTVFDELAKGDADASWRVARGSAIAALVEVALDRLSSLPAGDAKLQARIDALRAAVARYAQTGTSLAEFADLLAAQLKAVG
jgi:hypothetical protein